MSEGRLYFNGINGATGAYLLPPQDADALAARFIKGAEAPPNEAELKDRDRRKKQGFLGVKNGVNPLDLAQAGWGVIFAQADRDRTPALLDALKPLLNLRRAEAGAHYCEFHGEKGVAPGETKTRWLARMGVGPGPADPDKLPYYLLLIGDPNTIPYSFQYQLDVTYAVGRLHFESLDEYASYARSVALAESGAVALPRRAAFFGVQNLDDPATAQGANDLVAPLTAMMTAGQPGWRVGLVPPAEATKPRLSALLGGAETPALLFTESHGLYFPPDDNRHRPHGGALLCGEWRPAPGPVRPDQYLAADDIGSDARLHGLMVFSFACFSAGTPQFDDFAYGRGARAELAPQPFVGRLPQRLLGHPNGGALAVIGHVERAFPSSFVWGSAGRQLATFEAALDKLMNGERVGMAVEYFNDRYSELSTVLSEELGDIDAGKTPDAAELAGMWMANNDARNYAVIGDPAVRLPLAKNGGAAERVTLAPVTIQEPTMSTETPAAPPASPPPQATDKPPATPPSQPTSSSPFGAVGGMQPFTPFPVAPPDADRKANPELYDAWVAHVKSGYENGDRLFTRILNAFLRSHYSTVVMYWALFVVGIGAVIAGIAIALVTGKPVVGLAFAGLGVVAFLTYFVSFPTQALEENLLFITWLGVIYNSYWKDLALSFNRDTAQAELDKATDDAIDQIKELIAAYDKAVKQRPRPLARRGARTVAEASKEVETQQAPAR